MSGAASPKVRAYQYAAGLGLELHASCFCSLRNAYGRFFKHSHGTTPSIGIFSKYIVYFTTRERKAAIRAAVAGEVPRLLYKTLSLVTTALKTASCDAVFR